MRSPNNPTHHILLAVLLVLASWSPAPTQAASPAPSAAVVNNTARLDASVARSICADDPESCGIPPRWSASDWFASTLIGSAGMAVGGYTGATLGAYAAGDCDDSATDGGFGCLMDNIVHVGFGASVGALFGTASAVYAFGEGTGHSGNYWLTLAGSGTGLLASGLLIAAADGDMAVQFLSLALLPSLGATLGYVLSRDTSPQDQPLIGGLLTFDGGKAALGVPGVGVALSQSGDIGVDLTLVKGVF